MSAWRETVLPLLLGILLGVVVAFLILSNTTSTPLQKFCQGHVEGVAYMWLAKNGIPLENGRLAITEEMMDQAFEDCRSMFTDPAFTAKYPFPGPRR